MNNKKYIITALVCAVILLTGFFALHTKGEKLFDFSAIDENCQVYVVRADASVSEITGTEHKIRHEKFILEGSRRQQVFDFLNNATYRRRVRFDIVGLVTGIYVDKTSTRDSVSYRIVAVSPEGEEIMHLNTTGCDYISCESLANDPKIADRQWGEKLDSIQFEKQADDVWFQGYGRPLER